MPSNISARTRIGELDEEITVRRYTITRDEYGGEVRTWETLLTLWAKVDYAKTDSDEREEGGRVISWQRIIFTVRHTGQILPNDVILYDSLEHDILFVEKTGRKQFEILTTQLRQ